MVYIKYLFAVFVVITLNDAVKVNMQGSISLGKDVVDSISHYMTKYSLISARRSMTFNKDTDVIYLIITSSYICRELDFCEGKLEQFLNEFIMVLTKSIEAIFESNVSQKEGYDDTQRIFRPLIFEEELKKNLREIRKLLRNANMQVNEENDPYIWIEVIKKISVMFQSAAISFAAERLEFSSADTTDIQNKLTQKFVIATTIVEGRYESKLCAEHKICIKSYECTKALSTLLGSFKDMSEENVKIFIRYLSEALPDTKFYSYLNEVTSNELQIILNDMAYSDNVPTKEVLMSIQKTVEGRLDSIISKKHVLTGKDVELVYVILSDMDHVYGKQTKVIDPFHPFLSSFFEWSRTGARFRTHMQALLKDIADHVSDIPEDLNIKLINEVKAFLEITVDPVVK